jgi:hypothetical protein
LSIKTIFAENIRARRGFLAALVLVPVALYYCNAFIIAMRSDNVQASARTRQLVASNRAGD